MKKLLLILLSLILCFSAVACMAEDDASSTASTESKADESSEESVDNSDISSTESEVSGSVSDDASDTSSADEIILDMEKVVFFEGLYSFEENEYYTSNNYKELYTTAENSLLKHIENNDVSEDTRFYVGFSFTNSNQSDGEEFTEKANGLLSRIKANNIVLTDTVYNSVPRVDEMPMLKTEESIFAGVKEIVGENVDLSVYCSNQLMRMPHSYFSHVGYLDAEAVKILAENEDVGIYLTWLPSDENATIWLDSLSECTDEDCIVHG